MATRRRTPQNDLGFADVYEDYIECGWTQISGSRRAASP